MEIVKLDISDVTKPPSFPSSMAHLWCAQMSKHTLQVNIPGNEAFCLVNCPRLWNKNVNEFPRNYLFTSIAEPSQTVTEKSIQSYRPKIKWLFKKALLKQCWSCRTSDFGRMKNEASFPNQKTSGGGVGIVALPFTAKPAQGFRQNPVLKSFGKPKNKAAGMTCFPAQIGSRSLTQIPLLPVLASVSHIPLYLFFFT